MSIASLTDMLPWEHQGATLWLLVQVTTPLAALMGKGWNDTAQRGTAPLQQGLGISIDKGFDPCIRLLSGMRVYHEGMYGMCRWKELTRRNLMLTRFCGECNRAGTREPR